MEAGEGATWGGVERKIKGRKSKVDEFGGRERAVDDCMGGAAALRDATDR